MELRCENRMHGIVDLQGNLEVKCRDRFCGAAPGYVVLHTFDLKTGAMLYTNRFKDPSRRTE
jgi:hypothetical protein